MMGFRMELRDVELGSGVGGVLSWCYILGNFRHAKFEVQAVDCFGIRP